MNYVQYKAKMLYRNILIFFSNTKNNKLKWLEKSN